MKVIVDWVKSNLQKVLLVPAAISGLEFIVNLLNAASDGVITREELHTLVNVATPVEVVSIGLVMLALRKKD